MFLTTENIRSAKDKVLRDGYFLMEDGYSQETCCEIRHFIDTYVPTERTEINYAGTETRIWDAHLQNPLLEEFYRGCNKFFSEMAGRDTIARTLLAIRNTALDPDDEKSFRGRWHIDSFRRQLKIFLFLTATTEASGPFEFVPGTQTRAFKLRMVCQGAYFRPANAWTGKRAYQQLQDAQIGRLIAAGYGAMPIICKSGTVMVVDTSAIHRARPCREGSRYALTAYF